MLRYGLGRNAVCQIDSISVIAKREYPRSRESLLEQLLGPEDLSTLGSLASPRSVPRPR